MVECVLVRASDLEPRRPSCPSDQDLRQPNARRRLLMAYGKWTTSTGREVVFNRRYHPIWERDATCESWTEADPAEWVASIVTSETDYFYHDGHMEREKVRRASKAMCVLGVPWAKREEI